MGATGSSPRDDAEKQMTRPSRRDPGLDFDNSTEDKATSRHVGLENRAGENNCFLNATIQALWHLNMFRENVLYNEHTGGEDNIDLIFPAEDDSPDTLAAICSLFSQYQFTEEMCIPPTEIRYILSLLDNTGRFALGDIADAAETLDTILTHIHSSHVRKLCGSTNSKSTLQDFCHSGSSKCISHLIFGGVFVSQSTCCVCGATNEPAIIEPYFHYASVIAIVNKYASQRGLSFGSLLQHAFRNAATECPSRDLARPISTSNKETRKLSGPRVCTGKAHVSLACLEAPMVLAISLIWPSDSVAAALIQGFLDVMEGHVSLSEVFFSGLDNSRVANGSRIPSSLPHCSNVQEMYIFRGFVCFYGKHYISIFQEWDHRVNQCEYLLFDDARIRRLGPWRKVKEECVKARYQPVLLLYERQSAARK